MWRRLLITFGCACLSTTVLAQGYQQMMPVPVPKAQGGTDAVTGRAAAGNLSHVYVLCQSAVASSHTGNTTETTLATCQIPANALGTNGCVEIDSLFSQNNDASNKTSRVRFNGLAGTIYSSSVQSTNTAVRHPLRICNRNLTNSQAGGVNTPAFAGAVVTSAVDTTAAVDIVFTGQLADGADSIAVEFYSVKLMPSAGN